MILGKAIGDDWWIACSEGCKDSLVMKYMRIVRGKE